MRLGLCVLALVFVRIRQVMEIGRDVRVILSESALIQRKCATSVRDRLGVPALEVGQHAQIAER
jgi:hypothetical protein